METTVDRPIVSHKKRILNYLKQGNRLTALEALRYFDCLSLAQRIMDLRREGHDIKAKTIITASRKRIAQYYI